MDGRPYSGIDDGRNSRGTVMADTNTLIREMLVAALKAARADILHLGLRARVPTFGYTTKIDAALALARKA
jgi:hypothetical protein